MLLALLAVTGAGLAAADCPKAADWARAFYSEHYSFYADAPDPVLQFTEVGQVDYDPWLGARDGKIGRPVRFSVGTGSSDMAIVSMSYPFVLDPQAPA